jgi:uncharacterized coiled-coil protein SlyX
MSAGDGSLLLQPNSRNGEELIDALEKRVAGLVQRYQEARRTVDELRIRVAEGEAQCAELTSELGLMHGELEARDKLHAELRQRLDRVIEQFRKLEPTLSDEPRSLGGVASA